MIQIEHRIEQSFGELIAIDGDHHGNWVGAAGRGADQVILFNGTAIPLPLSCPFAMIRRIDSDTALLVNGRITVEGEINAWVVRSDGSVPAAFSVGDGVQDILVSENQIVVTYFDEGVHGSPGPNNEGVALFTTTGQFEWGYHTRFAHGILRIIDCYCATWITDDVFAIVPDDEFPFITIDLRSMQQKECPVPVRVHGSSALTVKEDLVYFHDPYNDKGSVFRWRIGSKHVEKIGEHSGLLRGMRGGMFFEERAAGYTIVIPEGEEESETGTKWLGWILTLFGRTTQH